MTIITGSPDHILKSVFGYDQFKPLQKEVIQNVLNRRDTLAIMPTGGGKSLCYQIPALIFSGLTVIVSPLISLMKDQVEQLQEVGIPALFLNSSLAPHEYRHNVQRVRSGEIRLLYVAPETLLTGRLFDLLSSVSLDCLTIDEAHCISEWGHDFRPEYRQLVAVRQHFPHAVCLALTATATRRVREDIKNSLNFSASNEFIASFNRENLFIEVAPRTVPAAQTLDFLQRFEKQSGIIYCFSRKQVDELSAFLAMKGFSVRPYHAGLEDNVRRENQELFIRDDVQIIVATIAFGMGINKPNVRFVIHYDLPKSIEGYYQEIGRAGRDGLPAHCLLLYSSADIRKQRYFIDQKEAVEREAALQHLNAMVRYAESSACRRELILDYFGEKYSGGNCAMCDNCSQSEGGLVDITIPAQKFMSCVRRTGERFAANHIAHVLLGVENDKVLSYSHQNLSTFGIGKELTRKQWLHIAHQLVQKGLLAQGDDVYRILKLTPEGNRVLMSREPVQGMLQTEETAAARKKKAGEIEYDQALFERLRQKRKEIADEAHVPPYVIFSDRTLVEMAAYYPMSDSSLKDIHGIGRVKLERYGETFKGLIQGYCLEHGLTEKPSLSKGSPEPRKSAPHMALNPRQFLVGETYNSGKSVDELVELFQVQRGTILKHLSNYVLAGNALRRGGEFLSLVSLPDEQKDAALRAFERLGSQYLKPVFDELGGAVNYDDLKVLRLHYLENRKT